MSDEEELTVVSSETDFVNEDGDLVTDEITEAVDAVGNVLAVDELVTIQAEDGSAAFDEVTAVADEDGNLVVVDEVAGVVDADGNAVVVEESLDDE
jgi:hypothetical protein